MDLRQCPGLFKRLLPGEHPRLLAPGWPGPVVLGRPSFGRRTSQRGQPKKIEAVQTCGQAKNGLRAWSRNVATAPIVLDATGSSLSARIDLVILRFILAK